MSFIILLVLGVMATFWLLERVSERRVRDARAFILDTRAIAGFTFLGEDLNCAQRLELRAIPNQRLVAAFGIDNSFTTTDIEYHKEFLTLATQATLAIHRVGSDTWARLFDVANRAINLADAHLRIESHVRLPQIPLAQLVRVVTFMTILDVLFVVDPVNIAVEDVVMVTQTINKLWMQSKGNSEEPISVNDQQRLRAALFNMLPDQAYSEDARNNPLNIIMPAYETMWRVVFLTFVEAAFRTSDTETMELFRSVTRQVPGCLGTGVEEHAALAFAREGLRLYPPTKRIYRGPQQKPWRADIERCHRDPIIWGRDALKFKPARFMSSLTQDQTRAYMPFSTPLHICPAARGFGERAIILLVVVLARHLGTRESGLHVKFGNKRLDEDMDLVLPNSRDAGESWRVIGH